MLETIFVLAVLGGLVVIWLAALVDAIRLPSAAWTAVDRSKERLLVLLVLTGGVGGLYWFARSRSDVVDAARALRAGATSRA